MNRRKMGKSFTRRCTGKTTQYSGISKSTLEGGKARFGRLHYVFLWAVCSGCRWDLVQGPQPCHLLALMQMCSLTSKNYQTCIVVLFLCQMVSQLPVTLGLETATLPEVYPQLGYHILLKKPYLGRAAFPGVFRGGVVRPLICKFLHRHHN